MRNMEQESGEAISIHAPRTGSDVTDAQAAVDETISIHAPRTGSDDGMMTDWFEWNGVFQSTLPARGATKPCVEFFYIIK